MKNKIGTVLRDMVEHIAYFLSWMFFLLIFRVIPYFLIKIKIEGKENIPKGGKIILAANHQNFFDGYLIAYALGPFTKPSFLISRKSLRCKLFEAYAQLIGSVVIDSDAEVNQRVFKELNKRLSRGTMVVIFPEGKISKRKLPDKFKGGIAKLSLDAKAKVVPMYLDGTYSLRYLKAWLGKPTVVLKIGGPVNLYEYGNLCNYDLEKMAAEIREEIIQLSGIVTNETEISLKRFGDEYLNMPIKILNSKPNETCI